MSQKGKDIKKEDISEAEKMAKERERIMGELGDVVYADLMKAENLIRNAQDASTEEFLSEITRWDDKQREKWALFAKYQDSESLELESLVYLELKRIFMLVSAADRKKQLTNKNTTKKQPKEEK